MRVSTPLFDRVSTKIAFPTDLDACWPWTGAKSQKRRGQLRPVIQEGPRGSKIWNVARWMLETYVGPAPTSAHEAGHTCPDGEFDLCVNPRHLVWMTRLENEQHKHSYR